MFFISAGLALAACSGSDSGNRLEDPGTVQQALVTPQHFEAFVWANNPSLTTTYNATPGYSYNSKGRVNTIRRLGAGQYRVTFTGISSQAGNAQVNAYGATANRCKVQSWVGSETPESTDLYVRCHTPSGALVDSQFVAFYATGSKDAPEGYAWSGTPGASHTPNASYSFNSAGGSNFVTRNSAGVYTVRFGGLNSFNGNVQVTAYGTGGEYCKVGSWSASADTHVNVRCHNTAGALTDSAFSVRYFTKRAGHGLEVGYLWANDKAATSYTPTSSYQYNSMQVTSGNTVRRWNTGDYTATLPLLSPTKSTPLVSAYGSDSTYCKPVSWSASGNGTGLGIACFNAQGQRVDAQYDAAYVTPQPSNYRVQAIGAVRRGVPGLIKSATGGSLTVGDPFAGAALRRYTLTRRNGSQVNDWWYVKTNGTAYKVLFGGGPAAIGFVGIEPDGRFYMVFDVDADGKVDILSSYHVDKSVFGAANSVGEAAIRSRWEKGLNPFCDLGFDHAGGTFAGADPRIGLKLCDANLSEHADIWALRNPAGPLGLSASTNYNPAGGVCSAWSRFQRREIPRRRLEDEFNWLEDTVNDFIWKGFDDEKDGAGWAIARAFTAPTWLGYMTAFVFGLHEIKGGGPLGLIAHQNHRAAELHDPADDDDDGAGGSTGTGGAGGNGGQGAVSGAGGQGGDGAQSGAGGADGSPCAEGTPDCFNMNDERAATLCSYIENERIHPWWESKWLGTTATDTTRCIRDGLAGQAGLVTGAMTGAGAMDFFHGFCQVSQPLPTASFASVNRPGTYFVLGAGSPDSVCGGQFVFCDPDTVERLQNRARNDSRFMGINVCPETVCDPLL